MKIGKTRLEVFHGEVTGPDVEAVVNPANTMLWMGGGTSAVIRKAGGETIEKEALVKAPAEIGNVVVTGGGTLKSRWVFHAVITDQDLSTNEKFIQQTILACYKKADEIRCKSIAVPLLNSIEYDVEIHIAAHAIIEETVDYLVRENSSLERVVFIECGETEKDIFTTALYEKFTKHG